MKFLPFYQPHSDGSGGGGGSSGGSNSGGDCGASWKNCTIQKLFKRYTFNSTFMYCSLQSGMKMENDEFGTLDVSIA